MKGIDFILKKKTKHTIVIGVFLIVLSLILHYAHYLIFRDAHHTLIFLFADIAFIPMEVFFTSIVLERLLERRDHEAIVEKLNMLIGLFFTELGTDILSLIVIGDGYLEDLRKDSTIQRNGETIAFDKLREDINSHHFNVDINKIDVKSLKDKLDSNKDLLVTLISNNNLHTNEKFTEMLMSLMHLKEELDSRYTTGINDYELVHLEKDISCCYGLLTYEWAEYMKYLSSNYPVLFSKALINNPFDNRCKKEKDSLYL